MKRLIIICEGQTEQEFCSDVLIPYLAAKGIYVGNPLIKKSGGGIVPWETLGKQIETHLKQDANAFVSTLIDYYGIPSQYEYPLWEEAHYEQNKQIRMDLLERGMYQAIDENYRNRFIPYIQLHEFEGLLFNNINVFRNNFSTNEFNDFQSFERIFNQYDNPEEINDGVTSAPSKRLRHHIKGYDKIVYGATLASEIGLSKIREKCPRFNQWINKLENI